VGTAQEGLRDLLRDLVAPALRAQGLKGTAGKYHLPDPNHFALVEWQRNTHSTSEELTFTVNLMVMKRSTWKDRTADGKFRLKVPVAGIYGWGEWEERIGFLMPEHRDIWWPVRAGEDSSEVGRSVVEALTRWGLPALRSHLHEDG